MKPSAKLLLSLVAFASACILAAGCGGSINGSTGPTAPIFKTQPKDQTVNQGQSATFSATAFGTAPLMYQWQKGGMDISGATSSSYTTPPATVSDNGATFDVVVTDSVGSATSNTAKLTVAMPGNVNVLTYHNDNSRTGLNSNETALTPANVNSTKFGKVAFLSVQGLVDAEPLYVSGLDVNGTVHNVVFVATEHDLIYAFDADTFAPLWRVSVAGANETPSDNRGCSQVTPEIGITSTPVIDPNAGPHGTIYVAAMSKDGAGNYFQRLHALDLTTGAELSGSPKTVQASYPGTAVPNSNGMVMFDPAQYKERVGLLLLNGVLYTGWASHCDFTPYSGWVIGYNATTLQQTSVFNFTPNGSQGSIWMSGAGLAADSSGSIYFLAGNGTFDTTLTPTGLPVNGDYGNGFIKLSTSSGTIAISDYFEMFNTVAESNADQDLGSGGALVLPDFVDAGGTTRHLAVGAGKDNNIYVVNRDSMGKFNSSNNNAIYQEIASNGLGGGGVYAMPAYFNNTVYYGAVGDSLRAFKISQALLVAPAASVSATSFAYPGTTPSISANGTSNGIVWAVEASSTGVLHAYDATNLANELYNSNQAGSRDQFVDNKFVTPMIANGKVFVGTPTGVAVFGLLP